MRLNHDEYYLRMLELVAARSTCARRAVGAIITNKRHQILSTGYNGVPSRFNHCTDRPCPGAGEPHGNTGGGGSQCLAVHAEVNALLQCSRLDLAHTMYVSCSPCFTCAKALCNTPLKRVVTWEVYPDAGADILRFADIALVVVPRPVILSIGVGSQQ